MHITAVILLLSFLLKGIIVSALRGPYVPVKLFSQFCYQPAITRYYVNNAKYFGEGKELWEHVLSEHIGYFYFNCSEQLLNDM